MQTAGGLSFPTTNVEGCHPNALSLQLTPPSKEICWGNSDDEAGAHLEGMALEKAVWARAFLAFACDLVNTDTSLR